jgi:hypothetical protein
VLLAISLLAVSSPASRPMASTTVVAAKQASALSPEKNQAPSSMLRASGYAIAKDKLD